MPVGTRNEAIKGCGTHHIAVQTRDWDKSMAFYQDVLGMKLVAEFGSPERKIVLLDAGDGSHIEAVSTHRRDSFRRGRRRQRSGDTLCSSDNRRKSRYRARPRSRLQSDR